MKIKTENSSVMWNRSKLSGYWKDEPFFAWIQRAVSVVRTQQSHSATLSFEVLDRKRS